MKVSAKSQAIKKSGELLQEALVLLAKSKHRMTLPRKELLAIIFAQKEPFSVPKLVDILSKVDGCDPVTIYRTLPVFEELGIIERCDFSDDMAHYEVALGRVHHHHHIVCSSCKKVEPLDFCMVDGQEKLLKKLGYTHLTHRLEFTGLCPSCSR